MVNIHLRQSKCDQFGKGVDIIIGRTDTPTCPIAAITNYILYRQDAPGSFFRMNEVAPATKSWFVDQIREVLSSIGLPQSDYAGHSFRIGAAVGSPGRGGGLHHTGARPMAECGVPPGIYIRMPREQLATMSQRLAHIGCAPRLGASS